MKRTVIKLVSKTLHALPGTKNYLDEKQRLYDTANQQAAHINFLEEQIKKHAQAKTFKVTEKPHIRFITNQLDTTGAPLIFMDVVKDFLLQHPESQVDLHTFIPVSVEFIRSMKNVGIVPVIHDNRDVALQFIKNDVVVLNTVAYSAELKNSVYEALEDGTVKKLVWYIHEDWPHIFFSEEERQKIKTLIENNKITIFCPAEQATKNIQEFFGLNVNISTLPYRLHVDTKYHHPNRLPEEFKKLKFIMVGKTGEGLKGHLPILYAFLTFKKMYYDKNPAGYRDFELIFIAIEADYLSLQIISHAQALGSHFRSYPPLSHKQTLEKIKDSNVTICYSIRECLPIFVFEGMMAGHVVLRNDVSGMVEQLQEGKNGYLLDSHDFEQVVDTIEKILNLETTTGGILSEMSTTSYKIASKFRDKSYQMLIDEISNNFDK